MCAEGITFAIAPTRKCLVKSVMEVVPGKSTEQVTAMKSCINLYPWFLSAQSNDQLGASGEKANRILTERSVDRDLLMVPERQDFGHDIMLPSTNDKTRGLSWAEAGYRGSPNVVLWQDESGGCYLW